MKLSSADLRDIVEEIVVPYMELHRGSRHIGTDENYMVPEGRMSDDEITDFVLSNPLLDSDTAWHLADPGLLGFDANYAEMSNEWLNDFRSRLEDWAATNEWGSGDLVYYHLDASVDLPSPESRMWTPDKGSISIPQTFLDLAPSHILLAEKILKNGQPLSTLHWRDFEKLIGDLLEESGWKVEVMRGTKDGGIDVVSLKADPLLGDLKAIWQAKKYSIDNKVGLASLREFSGVLDRERATKGVMVTTSSFTKGAVDWVKKDVYRLSSKDGEDIKKWIKQRLYKT